MNDDQRMIDSFRAAADAALQLAAERGGPSEYGVDVLQWLENDLEPSRDQLLRNEGGAQQTFTMIGSLLGECLCRAFGGTWVHKFGFWGVDIEDGTLLVFPFIDAAKFLHEGPAESFVSVFRSTSARLDLINDSRAGETSDRTGSEKNPRIMPPPLSLTSASSC